MRYYAARERKDGQWDYTVLRDGYVRPVGYCAGWEEWSESDILKVFGDYSQYERWKSRDVLPYADKFHSDGHDTEEQARSCYTTYLLDHAVCTTYSKEHACGECGRPTKQGMRVGECTTITLCGDHQDRSILESHFGRVGSIYVS